MYLNHLGNLLEIVNKIVNNFLFIFWINFMKILIESKRKKISKEKIKLGDQINKQVRLAGKIIKN